MPTFGKSHKKNPEIQGIQKFKKSSKALSLTSICGCYAKSFIPRLSVCLSGFSGFPGFLDLWISGLFPLFAQRRSGFNQHQATKLCRKIDRRSVGWSLCPVGVDKQRGAAESFTV
jgi:hypothetical protein